MTVEEILARPAGTEFQEEEVGTWFDRGDSKVMRRLEVGTLILLDDIGDRRVV